VTYAEDGNSSCEPWSKYPLEEQDNNWASIKGLLSEVRCKAVASVAVRL